MRFILLTTAAVLTLGSAASAITDPSGAKPDFPDMPCNIRMATTDGSNAAGGTGVEESADSKGASPEQGNAGIMPNSGAQGAYQQVRPRSGCAYGLPVGCLTQKRDGRP